MQQRGPHRGVFAAGPPPVEDHLRGNGKIFVGRGADRAQDLRLDWETANPEVVDPSPPGHVLQLVWERLLEEDKKGTAKLPDANPAPLDPLPSTVRIVCVIDPVVLADADLCRLHVGSFGKDHSLGCPTAPPHHAGGGARVEGGGLHRTPDRGGAAGPTRQSQSPGVHFRPWIVTGSACQHPAYVLW